MTHTMATQSTSLNTTPKDLIATLSLTTDETYLVQALGGNPVRLVEQDSSDSDPDVSTKAFILNPLETWRIKIASGTKIFAFTIVGQNDLVVGNVD